MTKGGSMPESHIETLYPGYSHIYSGAEYFGQKPHSNYTAELYSVLQTNLDPSKDVLSVSMFDTLIYRGIWSNLCFLWSLANLVAEIATGDFPASVSDVFFARYAAERRVRATRSFKLDRTDDVQFRINTHTSINMCGDKRFTDIISELENRLMSDMLVNSTLYEYCMDYRSRGGKVVICTSSILGESSIRKVFSNVGIESDAFTGIYSSGDARFKESDNLIYSHAQRDLCVAAVNIFHVGHDFNQDFRCSREAGCRALWLPLSDKIKQERVMNRSKTECKIVDSVGGAIDIEWGY